jgi:anti-anti-sigma factor
MIKKLRDSEETRTFYEDFLGLPLQNKFVCSLSFDSIDPCISRAALHPFKVEQLGTRKRLYGLEHPHQGWTNLLAMIRITKEARLMEITERRTAEIVTLSPSGKLDTTTAKTFEEKILAQIESGDRRFVIDLAQLDYISSAGLRVFVLAAKRLNSANGKMVLCALKDPVKEVFDIAGFSRIFSICGSHDEAIKNL